MFQTYKVFSQTSHVALFSAPKSFASGGTVPTHLSFSQSLSASGPQVTTNGALTFQHFCTPQSATIMEKRR